jgi:adenine-specific DNA-methyltransferase
VQIGDENVHRVRALMDEVFGADNHIANIAFSKTGGSTREYLGGQLDFLIWYTRNNERTASWFRVDLDGRAYLPSDKVRWKTNESGMGRLKLANRLMPAGDTLRYVRFIDDFIAYPVTDLWDDTSVAGFAADKRYVVETAPRVIERCILMTTDPGDLVLDPTCGSGTTVYVAEQWGRRWITIDTSRVALALALT